MFIEAAREAGYPETEDINDYQQEGFGHMDMTVHAARRWSAANARLKPMLCRPNLALRTNALATRLLPQDSYGTGAGKLCGGFERCKSKMVAPGRARRLRGPMVREQPCSGRALLREKIRRMPRH